MSGNDALCVVGAEVGGEERVALVGDTPQHADHLVDGGEACFAPAAGHGSHRFGAEEPSTIAAVIAAMACTADVATQQGEAASAELLLSYGDRLASQLEEVTVTGAGDLAAGIPRHYVRKTPAMRAHDECE